MAGKVTKESVDYRLARRVKDHFRRCGNCSMYRPDTNLRGDCTLVQGEIEDDHICNEWESK